MLQGGREWVVLQGVGCVAGDGMCCRGCDVLQGM